MDEIKVLVVDDSAFMRNIMCGEKEIPLICPICKGKYFYSREVYADIFVGFKDIDIFNAESLSVQNENLEKEVKKTLSVVDELKGLGEGTLNRLG